VSSGPTFTSKSCCIRRWPGSMYLANCRRPDAPEVERCRVLAHNIYTQLSTAEISRCWRSTKWLTSSLHRCITTLCVRKNITILSCYSFDKHEWIFIIFGRNVAKKVVNQKLLYFPASHKYSASAVPGELGNSKIAPFHLDAVRCFVNKRTKHKIPPGEN